jgi:hypothetical protein
MSQGPALDESMKSSRPLDLQVPNQHDFDTITAQNNYAH